MEITLSNVEELEREVDREAMADKEALRRVKRMLLRKADLNSGVKVASPKVAVTKSKPLTGAKKDVFDAAFSIPESIWTATDIAAQLAKAGKNINQTTMFGAIRKLRKSNEIVMVTEGSGRRAAQYKLNDAAQAEKDFTHGRRSSPEL